MPEKTPKYAINFPERHFSSVIMEGQINKNAHFYYPDPALRRKSIPASQFLVQLLYSFHMPSIFSYTRSCKIDLFDLRRLPPTSAPGLFFHHIAVAPYTLNVMPRHSLCSLFFPI